MRPAVRAYIGLTVVIAMLLVLSDTGAWPVSAGGWQAVLVIALVALCAATEHVSFQVHSGWATHAGTVPHLTAALLLPLGPASFVAGLGTAIYGMNRRITPSKAAFNTANVMVSVASAAWIAALIDGGSLLTESGGWRGLVAATIASVVYYVVNTVVVAGVVALDQRRSILPIVRGKLGIKALTEIGLGLVGAILAVVLRAAPAFAPALIFPAVLVFFAKRALDRTADQARELALTNRVGRAVAGTLRLDLAFEAITTREIRDALRLDGLALEPLQPRTEFSALVVADLDQPALRQGLAQRLNDMPARLHVYQPGEIPPAWFNAPSPSRHVAAAAIPCSPRGEMPVGALVAWRSADSIAAFDSRELLLLETLADYAAVALETTRLFHAEVRGRADAEEREARIRAVMENVADGLLTFDRNGIVEGCNPAAERIFGVEPGGMTGQSTSRFLPTAAAEASHHQDVAGHRFDGSSFPVELAVTDIPGAETPRFIAVVRDISERKAFEEQLRHMAFHDHLTGLPNRALFMDRVEHALSRADAQARSVAVLFIDLDNFKVVNDSLGHAAGDHLLALLSARLRASLEPQATLARFGGDEFTVLLEDLDQIEGEEDANAAARAIREALGRPLRVVDHEVFATASVGIALSTPGQHTPGDLVRNADVAMYRAKSNGRARSVVFDQSLDSFAVGRLELETELRQALEHNQLDVHFQPIVHLPTGRIQDMEALVRWRHPQHGFIPPDRFIPVAEDTGLIIPIGLLVLERACRQLRKWRARAGADDAARLSISVNLSARQFQHPTLVDDIARVLRETRLEPSSLMLEITESIAMRDAATTASILEDLKTLGVRLAIDDFGTGYSSLSYLHRFPIDVLKIDRSFVGRLGGGERNDVAIVEAVIALARGLSMEVTAEGIETNEQLTRLQALGCHHGQGYYFARPLPAEEATELLRQQRSSPDDRLPAAA